MDDKETAEALFAERKNMNSMWGYILKE